jgi:hypothetical protein
VMNGIVVLMMGLPWPLVFVKSWAFIRALRSNGNFRSNDEIATSPEAYLKRETVITAPRNDGKGGLLAIT